MSNKNYCFNPKNGLAFDPGPWQVISKLIEFPVQQEWPYYSLQAPQVTAHLIVYANSVNQVGPLDSLC